ncbi:MULTISPECIES: hypothetical protein [unclassified Microcoleus]|uniref:hypothetical protein n=1 Tax=unclassified Microcoleus TaxID=2642155 RepID=UPI002FCFD303
MGLLRDRKYANVASNLIELNLSPVLFARNKIEILSLFIKGFFEVELLVNNCSIKKEKINLGTYKVKGIGRDRCSNNSLTVIVTVNVNPFKWESFEYKLEVNGQEYDLIDK